MSFDLRHGECLDVLRSLPDASVDAVITDPPYSSGGQFRGDRMADTTTKYVQSGTDIQRANFSGDNRDQRAFSYWCALWLSECLRVAKDGAPIVLFTDWRQLPTTQPDGRIYYVQVPIDHSQLAPQTAWLVFENAFNSIDDLMEREQATR